jgi:hypothetical protein
MQPARLLRVEARSCAARVGHRYGDGNTRCDRPTGVALFRRTRLMSAIAASQLSASTEVAERATALPALVFTVRAADLTSALRASRRARAHAGLRTGARSRRSALRGSRRPPARSLGRQAGREPLEAACQLASPQAASAAIARSPGSRRSQPATLENASSELQRRENRITGNFSRPPLRMTARTRLSRPIASSCGNAPSLST